MCWLRWVQSVHDIARVDEFGGVLNNRDLVWTELFGKLLGLGGRPVVDDNGEMGEGVGQVPGYMITDGTQSVDANAVTMVGGSWTRVRQRISPVFHAEKGIDHFAILSDGDLDRV